MDDMGNGICVWLQPAERIGLEPASPPSIPQTNIYEDFYFVLELSVYE